MNKIRFIKMVLDAYILVAFVVLIFVSFQARLPLPKCWPLFLLRQLLSSAAILRSANGRNPPGFDTEWRSPT
jgi:hypothetical protein